MSFSRLSGKLGIFTSINLLTSSETMSVQKEMERGFSLQTTSICKNYTIFEIMFELMFIKVTWTQTQRDETF